MTDLKVDRQSSLTSTDDTTAKSLLEVFNHYETDTEVSGAPSRTRALLQTIRDNIIPQLAEAHANPERAPASRLTAADHDMFLQTLLDGPSGSALEVVDNLICRGISEEDIFLDLLSTGAMRLGTLWSQDGCSFSDVTIGLCTLHDILRQYSHDHDSVRHPTDPAAPRILLATADGDQHIFGLTIVAEFFRRDRWQVVCEPGLDAAALCRLVRMRDFDLVGLSTALDSSAEKIGEQIQHLRRQSRNRNVKIMVGGRLFNQRPDLVTQVDADLFAEDASIAPTIGRRVLAKISS